MAREREREGGGGNRKGDRERKRTDFGGETFAFHLWRVLTSAWIRQRVCSRRSVPPFGGRSCTLFAVKVSKCLQIMIFHCNFTCVLKPAVSANR